MEVYTSSFKLIDQLLSWEKPLHSLLALFFYLALVWFVELYMIPLGLTLAVLRHHCWPQSGFVNYIWSRSGSFVFEWCTSYLRQVRLRSRFINLRSLISFPRWNGREWLSNFFGSLVGRGMASNDLALLSTSPGQAGGFSPAMADPRMSSPQKPVGSVVCSSPSSGIGSDTGSIGRGSPASTMHSQLSDNSIRRGYTSSFEESIQLV
ncbi:unnamed protein product [Protopolystoma xenopodis]|uniref:Uncharacterized protein n=1 Tax=Protopolystoma xenopodis TaxID=117903 RepID=A0A3S5AD35_9PLAT|nr:unnamed protein product [Protopolystoma xenopodis]